MRLIDADAFIEYLDLDEENAKEDNLGEIVTLEDFDRQPTAFDLESVITKLKENEQDMLKAIDENSPSEWHMIKIMDLKALFEDYTKEQIEILNSAAKCHEWED